MANAAMMIQWGMPKQGRELKAIEVFMNHMQWWNELKASGKISHFQTYGALTGDMSIHSGMVIVEGSNRQIDELMASETYRDNFNRVVNVVSHAHVIRYEMGPDMESRMQRFGKVVKEIAG